MKSHIEEFLEIDKPKDYYSNLVAEIEERNREHHFITTLNSNIASEDRGRLPFTVKANICVKGFETTAGSKMLKGYLPPFDATVVERMKNSGNFSFLGETNMDEFGFGTFGLNTETPAKNAFDSSYVAGGSSAGAAVATAMLKYHIAIAESTGGSISTPSALNGVVGFTPTYGTVSRYGLIDYANSLDKIGVIARSAADARIGFDVIKGRDAYDTTCSIEKIEDSKKKKLFLIKELMDKAEEPVRSSFGMFLDKLVDKYEIVEIESSIIEKAIEPYYIIAMAEASTNLAKYNGYKYGMQYEETNKRYNNFFTEARAEFGSEAKRRIILGTFIRSESVKERYYAKATQVRSMVIKEMRKILKEGFIISPTLPIFTPKIEDALKLTPTQNYAMDVFTVPPNLGGFPHITFPYDYYEGMPLGAQIVTEHANDYALFDFVSEWEESFNYRFRYNLGEL